MYRLPAGGGGSQREITSAFGCSAISGESCLRRRFLAYGTGSRCSRYGTRDNLGAARQSAGSTEVALEITIRLHGAEERRKETVNVSRAPHQNVCSQHHEHSGLALLYFPKSSTSLTSCIFCATAVGQEY